MNKLLLYIVIVLSAAVSLAPMRPIPANAQQSPDTANGIEVSPALIEQVVQPGISNMRTIMVKNITSQPLALHLEPQAFQPNEAILDSTYSARYDVSSWIQPDPSDLILNAQESRAIQVLFLPPGDAAPGGHYASLSFQPLLTNLQTNNGTSASNFPQVEVLVMLIVPGEITEQLDFAKGLETKPLVFSGENGLSTTLVNKGNVHQLPRVIFERQDLLTRSVSTYSGNQAIILPGTQRSYSAVWRTRWWPTISKIRTVVDYGTPGQRLYSSWRYVFNLPSWSFVFLVLLISLTTLTVYITIKDKERWNKAWRALKHNVAEIEEKDDKKGK